MRKKFLGCILMLVALSGSGQRVMERLDRGVVAVRNPEGKVFVSWRLLGTEANDVSFNVYRSTGNGKPTKLNKQPVTKTTSFLDESATDTTQPYSYTVKLILQGKE